MKPLRFFRNLIMVSVGFSEEIFPRSDFYCVVTFVAKSPAQMS